MRRRLVSASKRELLAVGCARRADDEEASEEASEESTDDPASDQPSPSDPDSAATVSEDSPSESDTNTADTTTTMSSNSSSSASSAPDVDQPSDNRAAESPAGTDGSQPADVDADADDTPADASAGGAGNAATDDEVNAATEDDHLPDQFTATAERAILGDFFDAIGRLVDKCKLHISPDGISVSVVDVANVAMAELDLDAEAFEIFDATEGVIGISVDRMDDAIGLANKRDPVSFELDSDARELAVETDDIEYALGLIDPDIMREEPQQPDLQFDASLTVENRLLQSSLKAANMVSGFVELNLTKRRPRGFTFEMIATGDADIIRVSKQDTDDAIVDSTFTGDLGAMYSLDYLSDIRRALPNSGQTVF